MVMEDKLCNKNEQSLKLTKIDQVPGGYIILLLQNNVDSFSPKCNIY